MVLSITDLLAKPVINISQPTDIRELKLGQDSSLTLTNVTLTSATYDKQEPTGAFSMEDTNDLLSDITAVPLAHEGDDIAFDRIYEWRPDGDVLLYKCILRCACALNVSAYTSGTFDLTSADVTISIHDSAGVQIGNPFLSARLDATLAGLTGTGILVFIINDINVITTPIQFKRGNIVRLRIVINTSLGVGTEQVGILPVFPWHPESANKLFTLSALKMYTKMGIDNAYPVFSTRAIDQGLDYSGVNREGIMRGGAGQILGGTIFPT